MSDNKVTIKIDKGDAIAAYAFLRESVMRVKGLVAGMPADRQEVYLDQPKRWDRIAIALGEAAGEVDLPSLTLTEEAIDHIKGSGMDPSDLAERYGVSRRQIDLIQMGKQR